MRIKDHLIIFSILSLYTFTAISGQELEITGIPFQYRENPSTIVGLTQDNKGYIWMADITNGMFRYDGANLESFKAKPGNPNSLVSNRLECILADGNGRIWIGSYDRGLTLYDPESDTFTHFRHDDDDANSIRSDAIRALVVDSDGNLWIGTEQGLDKLDPVTGIFTHTHTDDAHEDVLSLEHIRAMYIDRSGTLWIGSGSPFPNEATVGGLFEYNISEGEIRHYVHSEDNNSLIDNRVRAIFEDSRGTFWIGTAGDGLHTMNREEGTFDRHQYDSTNPQKLSRPPTNKNLNVDDHITFINEDGSGNIWVGTFGGGLSQYDPQANITRHYSVESSEGYRIPNNTFWYCLKTDDDLLWMSTWIPESYDNVLLKLNSNPNKIYHQEIDGAGIIYSFADDDGVFFFGSRNGFWQKDPDKGISNIFRLERQNIPRPGARHIEMGINDNIWVATGRGLYRYNKRTETIRIFDHDPEQPNSISSSTVITVHDIGNSELPESSQIQFLHSHYSTRYRK